MSEFKNSFSDKTANTLTKKSAQSLKDMLKGKSFMDAANASMKLVPQIIKAEAPYKKILVDLAKEIIRDEYPIIDIAGIELQAELVGFGNLNMTQSSPPTELDIEDFEENSGIDKRRIINSITQGASIRGTKSYYIFKDIIDSLDSSLLDKYNTILSDSYGIYDDDNAIAMMLAMMAQNRASQGGESQVDWDDEAGTLVIKAKAVIFPILVHELIKGLYEILSLQGFSADAEKNKSIVNKVDKVTNEPEDLRYGKFIYDALANIVADSQYNPKKVRELFFIEVYKMPDQEFRDFIENAINDDLTPRNKNWINQTLKTINDENN